MMKKTMGKIGMALVAILAAQSISYGEVRYWKGEFSNGFMSRDENWYKTVPGGGHIMSWDSHFSGSEKQPVLNLSRLTEQMWFKSSLTNDVQFGGNANQSDSVMRIRSTDGIAINHESSVEVWFDMSGEVWQDNDINPGGATNTVKWSVTEPGGTLIMSPGSGIRFDTANNVMHTLNTNNIIDIRSAINNGNRGITKTGAGTLILGSGQSYNYDTVVQGGTLQLGGDDAIDNVSDLIFEDGTTFAIKGYSDAFATLDINGTVTFDFESLGTSQISFKDSSAVVWGTPSLNITSYTAESDSVRFSTNSSGLTLEQLSQITVNGVSGYSLDSDGYLVLAGPADDQEWVGGTNADWYVAANWASNSVPGVDGIAIFDAAFASSNAQPTVTSNAVVDELRVIAPEQDVVVSVASGAILNIDHNASGAHASINLASAVSNLTISGDGGLVQQPGNDSDPLWDVTSTNGGDLTIDTDSFVISNGVALTINVDALRTVDMSTGADVSSASVTKSGEGLLILGGSNGWTGDTTVDGGILQLTADNALSASSAVILNDGATLDPEGVSGSFGTLEVNGTVTFDLDGSGTNALAFADSSGVAWGSTLVITNYADGVDTLRFGTNSTALTEAQLADITLNGEGNLVLTDSGYLVVGPVPVGDIALGTVPGVGVSLTWGGVVGQSYDVEYSTNLVTGTWMVYTNILGAGGDISVTSSVVNAAEFYRVTSEFSE